MIPDLLWFKLPDIHLALSKPGERKKVQIICNLQYQVMEDKPIPLCRACRFQGNVMHWL